MCGQRSTETTRDTPARKKFHLYKKGKRLDTEPSFAHSHTNRYICDLLNHSILVWNDFSPESILYACLGAAEAEAGKNFLRLSIRVYREVYSIIWLEYASPNKKEYPASGSPSWVHLLWNVRLTERHKFLLPNFPHFRIAAVPQAWIRTKKRHKTFLRYEKNHWPGIQFCRT